MSLSLAVFTFGVVFYVPVSSALTLKINYKINQTSADSKTQAFTSSGGLERESFGDN
jgi:hypothetical protein